MWRHPEKWLGKGTMAYTRGFTVSYSVATEALLILLRRPHPPAGTTTLLVSLESSLRRVNWPR